MDLVSGQPFWLLKNGLLRPYERLQENLRADVVVLGGGISGALVTWHLARAGHRVVTLDRRHIAMGSTCASTALLQYEMDTPLIRLRELVGEGRAVRSYLLSVEAIEYLAGICRLLGLGSFRNRPSLYFASLKKHAAGLEAEYRERRRHGIELECWDAPAVERHFPRLKAAAALWSETAAVVDPFELTHALFNDSQRLGARVYDCTEVTEITHRPRSVELLTRDGQVVKAGRLVIACGYESQQYLPRPVIRLHSTYAVVSKPLSGGEPWYREALLWETARPYLYARTTADGRAMAGGKDEPFYSPARRDRLLGRKSLELETIMEQKFLGQPFPTDFCWTGTFGETLDGLPYVGTVAQRPHTYFVLGVGGNGIVFSAIAAQVVEAEFSGKKHEAVGLFAFDR